MWQVGLAFGRLVGLLCGHVVAPSGTLLVAYQTCPADQDTFLFSRGAAISKQITDVFLNCVLFAQFLVFCLAFHRLMVCNIF